MTTVDIIEKIRQLPPRERLVIVESTLQQLRAELAADVPGDTTLRTAAETLQRDYAQDPELTAFRSLDGEPIHA